MGGERSDGGAAPQMRRDRENSYSCNARPTGYFPARKSRRYQRGRLRRYLQKPQNSSRASGSQRTLRQIARNRAPLYNTPAESAFTAPYQREALARVDFSGHMRQRGGSLMRTFAEIQTWPDTILTPH